MAERMHRLRPPSVMTHGLTRRREDHSSLSFSILSPKCCLQTPAWDSLAGPPFSSQQGEHWVCVCVCVRETESSRSSSLISHLTKASDEDNKRSPSALCLSAAPSYLSVALLCLTVRALVEHGSPDTFHISSSLLCALSHVRARVCACERESERKRLSVSPCVLLRRCVAQVRCKTTVLPRNIAPLYSWH